MKLFSFKELLLSLTGTLLLIFVITHYYHPTENRFGIGSDTYEFWHLSSNILNEKGFFYSDLTHYPLFDLENLVPDYAPNGNTPCTARVPGYPLILALFRGIWDSSATAIILNLLAFIGICLYGFLLFKMLIPSPKMSWIYNLLLVFSPFYYIQWGVGAEFLASFLLTGFTYHTLRLYLSEHSSKKHILFACLWGVLANLTRANLIVFTGTLLATLCVWSITKQNKQNFTNTLIILLVLILGMGSWMYRNKQLTDKWLISTQGGFVLYAVHLSYDIDQNHPLYSWFKEGRKDLFLENIHQGKTFNETEAIIDQKLKSVVFSYFKERPLYLIKKWSDGLRTFFFFSYHDISDIIIHMRRPSIERYNYIHSNKYIAKSSSERIAHQILFQCSRLYKILIAFCFFLFPLICFRKNSLSSFQRKDIIFILYIATFLGVLLTAFFTGAGGDRLRIPFNVFILMFVVLFATNIKNMLSLNSNKNDTNAKPQ